MRGPVLTLLLLHLLAAVARGQIGDDFADGDFTNAPVWSGETERWQVASLNGSAALRSRGEAGADTIHLALPTEAAFGRWDFLFAHQNVNLGTVNGARIFFSIDQADPNDGATGYYIQLGTNNEDVVSLWRLDGGLTRRTELARSAERFLEGDSSLLHISVERDPESRFAVRVDGAVIIEAFDSRHADGQFFTLWVKHNAQGAESFFFDEISIQAVERPEAPPPRGDPVLERDVIINEIYFQPVPGGSEFIELYNRSERAVDLSLLTFRDSRSPRLSLADAPTFLEPGGYAVVVADADEFVNQFRRVPFLAPSRWASLNNGGDAIIIEANGASVDSVSYDGLTTASGQSLERIDPNGPSEAYNFGPSRDPFGATPGEQNSIHALDANGPVLLFAEEVDDRHVDLYFDEPLLDASLQPDHLDVGGLRPSRIDRLTPLRYRAEFSRAVDAPAVELSRAIDRAGNVSEHLLVPVSFLARSGDLIINEILYQPLTDPYDGIPDQAEFVELFNRSRRRLSLNGLIRTREPDESGHADTLEIGLPMAALEPEGFYLIAGDSAVLDLEVATAIHVRRELSLRNEGDVIGLHGPDGVLIDYVGFSPAWHHPDLLDHRGVSLERIDVHGLSGDRANWSSSAASSGSTPGLPNSVRLRADAPTGQYGISLAPNPFSPDRDGRDDVVAIAFRLRADVAVVRVRIYDIRGYPVRTLVGADLAVSEGTLYWDGFDDLGRRLRVGVYVVVLEAADRDDRTIEVYKTPVVLAQAP